MARTLAAIFFAVGCVLFFGALSGAQAADITWSAVSTISGDTDVSTAGTLVDAYNIGDPGVSSVTVNGVTFAAFPIVDGTPGATNGNLSVTGFGGQPVASGLNLGSANPPFSLLSANYQTLLSTGVVKAPFVQFIDMLLSGLTVGNTYTVQLWTNDSSAEAAGSPTARREFSDFTGNFSPLVDANVSDFDGGVGQFIFGTFVADDVTEFISAHGAFNPTGTDGAIVNALQVRTSAAAAEVVPEPSTMALAALGVVVLAVLARRRR